MRHGAYVVGVYLVYFVCMMQVGRVSTNETLENWQS